MIDHGMSESYGERIAGWITCMIRQLGLAPPGARVLELGCGNGVLVEALRRHGLDALGCDVEFKAGPRTQQLHQSGTIALIGTDPYRLPFDDGSFDLVFSISVLEHVMNVDETIAEAARVTKPGGTALHIFPARYRPVEPHTFVPLGTLLRSRWWLRLWATAGVRNSYQRDLNARDAAAANHEYLNRFTNYLTRGAIREAFGRHYASVEFCEAALVGCMTGTRSHRLGMGPAMRASRLLSWLYSEMRERAVWMRKA